MQPHFGLAQWPQMTQMEHRCTTSHFMATRVAALESKKPTRYISHTRNAFFPTYRTCPTYRMTSLPLIVLPFEEPTKLKSQVGPGRLK